MSNESPGPADTGRGSFTFQPPTKEQAKNINNTYYLDAVNRIARSIDDTLFTVVKRMDDDDELDLDNILISLAEARAGVVMARMQATLSDRLNNIAINVPDDQPRVFADELLPGEYTAAGHHAQSVADNERKNKLPKLKPQGHAKVRYKHGITKLLRKAIEFDCPTCHAEAGTFCFLFTGPGTHTQITDKRNDGKHFHTKRTDLSTAANDRIRKANILEQPKKGQQ